MSVYDDVGGEQFFRDLVSDFYQGVAADPVLRPMYPEEDLGPAADRLTLFLMQYWGGPRTYSEQRGHPRLRLRHAPFDVDDTARDHWLGHMRTALDARSLAPDLDDQVWNYLVLAAHSMVNQPTEPVRGLLLDPPSVAQ